MRLKQLFTAVPALALLAATGACDEGLTEINVNPNEPEVVPAENLLANAIMDAVGGAYGSHGVWYGLYLTNLWSQHLAQPVYNDEDLYIPRPAQLNSIWASAYTGPLVDLDAVQELAAASGNENLVAVAEVLEQWQYQILTDTYGAIPYSEAIAADEGITSPAYDPQEAVYNGILTSLTQASQAIDPTGSGASFADGDLIYSGDLSKWEKFANSLRLRAAMRLAEVDPATAEAEFVAAYNAGVFESNADNATLNWGTQRPSQNPLFEQFESRPLGDFVLSEALVSRLEAMDDPRLEVFGEPALNSGEYNGLPNGSVPEDFGNDVADYSFLGEYFREADAPSVLMSYAEVLFLEAEAAERGWIAGDPEELWRQAIEASLEQYDIEQAEIDAYLAGLTYEGLPSIWTQEWIALYMNGGEAWALVRRTGYPQLTPATGDQIPMRLVYPPDEENYNPDNYREDVTLFDPLWWAAG